MVDGSREKPGIDYDCSRALDLGQPDPEALRFFVAHAVVHDFDCMVADAASAYLQAELPEHVYVVGPTPERTLWNYVVLCTGCMYLASCGRSV